MKSSQKQNKKILFISQSFYPAVGGVSTFLASLIHNLIPFNYEIHVLHFKVSDGQEPDAFKKLYPDVVQYEIDRRSFTDNFLNGYTKFKEVLYKRLHGIPEYNGTPIESLIGYNDYRIVSDRFLREAEKIIHSNAIEVVNIQDYQMFGCLKLHNCNVKKVLSLHAPILDSYDKSTDEWLRKISSDSDRIVVSIPEYKNVSKARSIFDDRKVVVIPPFIDPVFQQALFGIQNQPQPDIQMSEANINFTCIQRFDSKSGQLQLIKAFSLITDKHPNAKLILVGGPSFTDSISNVRQKYFVSARTLVQQLGIEDKVIFLGNIDYAWLPIIYKQSDVICMLSRMECFGLAITEALYYNLPVLVTSVGGLDYQVTHRKNGLKVEVDNINQTASALAELAASARKRKALGDSGKAIYEKEFSPIALTSQYNAFYKSL